MKSKTIYIYSFLLSFSILSILCVINSQPLIFYPIRYSWFEFTKLAILLGLLNLGLIYVLTKLEKYKAQKLLGIINPFIYFILSSVTGLFIFTLFSGFVESRNPFFYYYCVQNSCYYLTGGYTTTIFAALLFGLRYINKNEKTDS